ncbi:hypothetical protein NP233_g8624 [Leucocoprinus birnbaumii]|uniref:NmrA-like domain-containing protein n=1 Tax=Leucocoprinus birnbaumii TaxID=56174 RepID=A0AAD5YTK2_9AGAR|nr:hypothetical protein NP233_g8624 [Leucocoprinus birnbaumii]
MPLKVAVAGVTNGLGYGIALGLLNTADLDVIHLTRASSSADLSHFTSRGATVKSVNYNSIPNITSALGGVDTVISTIFVMDNPQPTLNLIKASKAAGVRRFAPSEFVISQAANARIDLYAPKRTVLEALRESGLEYTLFQNGVFMDYFAFGAPRLHEGPLKMFPFILDISSQKATIPGTGNEKVTFTTVNDIGRFVAAAVKLEGRWPEELGMEGETTTYNHVVKQAEDVTGKKVDVEYLDKEKIGKMLEESRGETMKYFTNQCYDILADNMGAVEPRLNKLVPQVTPVSVKEYISQYWGA